MFQLKKKIKSLLTSTGPKIERNLKTKLHSSLNKIDNIEINSFGEKNINKVFYVIKRSPGSGFFSNFIYVLNHINICEKFNFIPIIDMKNFKTIYNERKNFLKGNAWNYYFKNLNKYTLSEVYKSKNVIFSGEIFNKSNYFNFEKILFEKKLNKYFKNLQKKYIKINPEIKNEYNKFVKKFKNEKVLGLHLRGTTYKNAPKHPYPLPVNLAKTIISDLIDRYNYSKIFLITEEKKYIEEFRKKFGSKLIFFDSHRSYTNDAFVIYPRKNHRFKMGKEILIECLIMSKCDGVIINYTNVSSASVFFSKKKQKIHKIFLGFNSSNIFIASFLWYVKKMLPKYFFGFDFKIN